MVRSRPVSYWNGSPHFLQRYDTDSGSESAEVLSVGPTVEGIRVGDRIKFSGAATGATVDGTHFYFVRATEVICLTRAGTVAS